VFHWEEVLYSEDAGRGFCACSRMGGGDIGTDICKTAWRLRRRGLYPASSSVVTPEAVRTVFREETRTGEAGRRVKQLCHFGQLNR